MNKVNFFPDQAEKNVVINPGEDVRGSWDHRKGGECETQAKKAADLIKSNLDWSVTGENWEKLIGGNL